MPPPSLHSIAPVDDITTASVVIDTTIALPAPPPPPPPPKTPPPRAHSPPVPPVVATATAHAPIRKAVARLLDGPAVKRRRCFDLPARYAARPIYRFSRTERIDGVMTETVHGYAEDEDAITAASVSEDIESYVNERIADCPRREQVCRQYGQYINSNGYVRSDSYDEMYAIATLVSTPMSAEPVENAYVSWDFGTVDVRAALYGPTLSSTGTQTDAKKVSNTESQTIAVRTIDTGSQSETEPPPPPPVPVPETTIAVLAAVAAHAQPGYFIKSYGAANVLSSDDDDDDDDD